MKCAICRTAEAGWYFGGGKKIRMCDRCYRLAEIFIGTGMAFEKSDLSKAAYHVVCCEAVGMLSEEGLIDTGDVIEVSGTVLQVNGCTVNAPVCRVCGSDRDIIVKDFDDGSWAYFCTRCDRVIPFEEFSEGNP